MAFVAESEEYRRLYSMFLDGTLNINATAKDVLHDFPTLMGKTGEQIRGGFNRCKTKAKAALADQEGKLLVDCYFFYLFFSNDDVVVIVVTFIDVFLSLLEREMYTNAFAETGRRTEPFASAVGSVPATMIGPVTKKSKTGPLTKVKNVGQKLDSIQQAAEVDVLNPLARSHTTASGSAIKSFVGKTIIDKNAGSDSDDDDKPLGHVNSTNTNSTKNFCPHHFSFKYNDRKGEYCCMVINIPSGLTTGGLDGKIHPTVSGCRTKLLLEVEWPPTFLKPKFMIAGLEKLLLEKDGKGELARTCFNMANAYEQEIIKIRNDLSLMDNIMIGGTASFALPFECEKEIYLQNSTIHGSTGSVTTFVVVKKLEKAKKLQSLSMGLDVIEDDDLIGMSAHFD